MRLFIVTAGAEKDKLAVAAFSTKERAVAHIAGQSSEEASEDLSIENFDTPDDAQFSTLFVFAVYQGEGYASERLMGYFYFRWEAEEAHEKNIRVERLEIDSVETDTTVKEEKPKKTEPTEEEKEIAEAVASRPSTKPGRQVAKRTSRRSSSLRKLVIFYVLLVVLLVVNILTHRKRQAFEFAEGVDSVEWLPTAASNISYYRDARLDVYEFTITFEEFESWAKGAGFSPVEIIGEPLIITRYGLYVDIPVEGADDMTEEEKFRLWEEQTKAYVFKGYQFKGFDPEENTEVLGGYDTEFGRAYFKSREVKK